MRAFICDPNLRNRTGHFHVWARQFVSVSRDIGAHPTVITNKRFEETSVLDAPVVAHFTRASWHMNNETDLLANWDYFHYFNNLVLQDMRSLFSFMKEKDQSINGKDILIFPALAEHHLYGVIKFLTSLPEDKRPQVLCFLMAPSGCFFEPVKRKFLIHARDTARFYKLAFREAKNYGNRIQFFALGEAETQGYQWLRENTVSSYPLLHPVIQQDIELRDEPCRTVLLYCGDYRMSKGCHLMPQIAQDCCRNYPDWQFRIHLGIPPDSEMDADYWQRMQAVSDQYRNFELIMGVLDDKAYSSLFLESEIAVAAYHKKHYYNLSSGVVWEAIATANTLVVPKDTWLEREAGREDAAYVCFHEQTEESVFGAIKEAIEGSLALRQRKLAIARAFREKNNMARLEKLLQSILVAQKDNADAR